jgi:hypothetical protein
MVVGYVGNESYRSRRRVHLLAGARGSAMARRKDSIFNCANWRRCSFAHIMPKFSRHIRGEDVRLVASPLYRA